MKKLTTKEIESMAFSGVIFHDVINLCEYVSMVYELELTIEEGAKVFKQIEDIRLQDKKDGFND